MSQRRPWPGVACRGGCHPPVLGGRPSPCLPRAPGGYRSRFLSDRWPVGAVAKLYGVWNEDASQADRGTFILDAGGGVRYVVHNSSNQAATRVAYVAALEGRMGRQINTGHVPALTPKLSQSLDELEQARLVPIERDAFNAVFDTGHHGFLRSGSGTEGSHWVSGALAL